MSRIDVLRLMAGFRKFRERYFQSENSIYAQKLSAGQSPKTLMIACSDSRVDPAIITSAEPGDLFVIRNVANLVPPYDLTGGFHGVSSAIEFSVVDLKVENVIVLGHRQCGGIRALMLSDHRPDGFVHGWMQIAKDAKKRVLAKHKNADAETLCRQCEREAILTSIRNLRTFPFIRDAVRDRGLTLMGVYFDLEEGEIYELDEESGNFTLINI